MPILGGYIAQHEIIKAAIKMVTSACLIRYLQCLVRVVEIHFDARYTYRQYHDAKRKNVIRQHSGTMKKDDNTILQHYRTMLKLANNIALLSCRAGLSCCRIVLLYCCVVFSCSVSCYHSSDYCASERNYDGSNETLQLFAHYVTISMVRLKRQSIRN